MFIGYGMYPIDRRAARRERLEDGLDAGAPTGHGEAVVRQLRRRCGYIYIYIYIYMHIYM
jgi:hypothetical protein